MLHNPDYIFSRFVVCGISYQKTDASTRSLFHIDEETKALILENAGKAGIRSLFILSTCNRTELYAYVPDEEMVSELFISTKNIDPVLFREKSYIKKGEAAVQHLFCVAAGLDSQILGDYEILGQLKQSIAFSQKLNMIGPIMDRTINFALQASKKVKTQTSLSSGSTSVSFAAIEWLKKNIKVKGKKIALIGLGKFGTLVGKNLKYYIPEAEITVSNRTNEKAESFAEINQLNYQPFEMLPELVDSSDIIIVSTQAPEFTVIPEFLVTNKERVFMDLSIPSNIDTRIKNIPSQTVVNVDDISIILNQTLEMRKNEIPKARTILLDMLDEFTAWLASYSHAPLVKEMKEKLFALSKTTVRCEMADNFSHDRVLEINDYSIKKTISRLAINLRTKNEKGCQLIEAYNHFLNYHHSA